MPVFASVAAHVVIDTFALLMWHQVLFSRLCRESLHLPHLKTLIDYYLRQCSPAPLMSLLDERVIRMPDVFLVDSAANQDGA